MSNSSNGSENGGTSNESRKQNNRPQSMLALEFSAALDDLFKLNGIGALEESVEHKKEEVHYQRYQLEDLDARLRETSERLKRLEARSRRATYTHHQQQQRQPVSARYQPAGSAQDDDSSGDSDEQGRSSPLDEHVPQRGSR